MNMMELIKTRRSVRTFDGRTVSTEDIKKLSAFMATIENPYKIPVEFILLNAKEHGLFSPVIAGENLYVAAKVARVPHSEEAFGFSFEKMVLCAWSLGIGTTWIGGTLKRDLFEKAAEVKDNEGMYCVSPLGYPAEEMSKNEVKMRKRILANERLSATELFFNKDFNTPLNITDEKIKDALEAVRLAPSAANMQPWRIIKDGNSFHFYEVKTLSGDWSWDVQKIDIGIALCHFMSMLENSKCTIENPNIATSDNVYYIATVIV